MLQTQTTKSSQTDQMHGQQPAVQWAMCWAVAVGKCSGYPGCRRECSFYEPTVADMTINVTTADLTERVP